MFNRVEIIFQWIELCNLRHNLGEHSTFQICLYILKVFKQQYAILCIKKIFMASAEFLKQILGYLQFILKTSKTKIYSVIWSEIDLTTQDHSIKSRKFIIIP